MPEPLQDDTVRRLFLQLRRDGHLDLVLRMLAEEEAAYERDLRGHLHASLLSSPETQAEALALQGSIKALAGLRSKWKTLATERLAPDDA